jgi:hypothetical protein
MSVNEEYEMKFQECKKYIPYGFMKKLSQKFATDKKNPVQYIRQATKKGRTFTNSDVDQAIIAEALKQMRSKQEVINRINQFI